MISKTHKDRNESPDGWRWIQLGNVCREDKRIINPESDEAKELSYLSLEHIESETGRIVKNGEYVENEGQSTTFYFNSNHVLYGKLRPYLNKVVLPEYQGRCSTELVPFLPVDSLIIREFLAWTLRRRETVEVSMRGVTGSRMPRANMKELLQMSIPLPPLSEQRRIVKILNQQLAAVEQARQAAQEQLEAANCLFDSELRDVFSPENMKRWDGRPLGEVSAITAKQVDPTLPDYRDLPHVNGENIESGTGSLLYLNTAAQDNMTSGKYLFESCSVLYSKLRPYLRKATLADSRP